MPKTSTQSIAVDLRSLNYPYITGVNLYILHFLFQLSILKKASEGNDFELVAIGLDTQRLSQLCSEYPFLKDLFDRQLSLQDYLNLPRFLGKYSKLINLYLYLKAYFKSSLTDAGLPIFNYLFLPQPKILPKHPNTKLITVFHDLYSLMQRTEVSPVQLILENKFYYSLLAQVSWQVWGVSLATCRDIQKILKVEPEKIKWIYSGIPEYGNPEFFLASDKPKLELPKSEYILAISGIEPRKNWYNLLLAHKYLQLSYPDYNLSLVLAGRPVNQKYYRKLLNLVTEQQIQKVTWYLDLEESNKPELIQNCSIFAYPSFYEGFGFPILEALKYQKPIITSKISSMPELAGSNAMYVNPLNFYDIARAIYIIQKDKVFQANLVKSSTNLLDAFNWEELAIGLQKLLQNH